MFKPIAIGSQSFSSIIEEDCFFVDKTMFIKDWWESKDSVTLITRPRRFGKTLNMDMINCFFNMEYENRGDLFEGLKIWEHEEYKKLQGTQPVLFLSFAGIKEKTYERAVLSLGKKIKEIYVHMKHIINTDKFDLIEKDDYQMLMRDVKETDISDSLNMLYRYIVANNI